MMDEYTSSYWVVGFLSLLVLVGIGFGLYYIFANQPPAPPPTPPNSGCDTQNSKVKEASSGDFEKGKPTKDSSGTSSGNVLDDMTKKNSTERHTHLPSSLT